LFLPLPAQSLNEPRRLIDPIGVAGCVVELAGGDWGVEYDVGHFQYDQWMHAELIWDRRSIVVCSDGRFELPVLDAVGKEVGLAD